METVIYKGSKIEISIDCNGDKQYQVADYNIGVYSTLAQVKKLIDKNCA